MKDLIKKTLLNLDVCLAALAMMITISLVIINVFTRYFMNFIIVWSEEVATTCFVYSVFIGAAYVYRLRMHVGVDMLVKRLPMLPRNIVHFFVNSLMLFLNAYITFLSWQFITSPTAWIKKMPMLRISAAYLNSALLIGFGLMTLYAVYFWIQSLKELRNTASPKDDV